MMTPQQQEKLEASAQRIHAIDAAALSMLDKIVEEVSDVRFRRLEDRT